MTTYNPIKAQDHPGWYEIPGYSGYCANRSAQVLNKKTGNISEGGDAGRYLRVSAYPDHAQKPRLCYLHELICLAFHGPRPENQVVLHKDNERFNCIPSNLFWGTQSMNIKQTYQDSLRYPTRKALEAFSAQVSIPLYHITLDRGLPEVLKPRLPHARPNHFDDAKLNRYKEEEIPRVSFGPSVEHCITSIYPNVSHHFEGQKGNEQTVAFHVFKAKPVGTERILLPQELSDRELCWDAHVTAEHCYLDPIKIVYCGVVEITVANSDKGIRAYPYNDSKYPVEIIYPGKVFLKKTIGIRSIDAGITLYRNDIDYAVLENYPDTSSESPTQAWMQW